jgi:prolyl oligopeptidase
MQVHDPYRALEEDGPTARAWIDAHNERTRDALAASHSPETAARLKELLSIGYIDSVALGGERVFVTKREGDREQAALYLLGAAGAAPELLIDPLQWGERAALDWSYPSPDGRYVAFGVSANGDERSVLHVLDVDARKLSDERIDHAKWSSVAWLNDASGFYYTRYPRPGEPGYDEEEPDTYFPRVFFHALGSDPARDPNVFESSERTDFPYVAVGDEDRYVVVGNFRGWTASDLFLLDRGARASARVPAPDDAHPLQPVVEGLDKLTTGVMHRGWLYLATNIDAPKKRLVRVRPAQAAKQDNWQSVVPEGAGVIDSWTLSADEVIVHTIEAMSSRLVRHALGGGAKGDVALPARGSVGALTADPHERRFAFTFDGYFHPPALFLHDAATPERASAPVFQVAHDLDTSAFATSEATVTSADGTPVHVWYVHRKEMTPSGNNPVLLYGYGGFDVSLLPRFTRSALYWIERGGVYAVANLRGGGELGEAWHRAGMLENKPRVFEDFEAVIRWLTTSGISRPGRIAITGGSNGGLLIGALLTRAPETFGAAAAYVGLYDMLRYHLFPPAALWISEYGDPRKPEDARWLGAYSPYHNVRDGTAYPATLIETADHDTRVHWAHSTKFAARLQHAQAADQPIYFLMERKQGHGRGTRLSDLVRRYERQHAFLRQALQLP